MHVIVGMRLFLNGWLCPRQSFAAKPRILVAVLGALVASVAGSCAVLHALPGCIFYSDTYRGTQHQQVMALDVGCRTPARQALHALLWPDCSMTHGVTPWLTRGLFLHVANLDGGAHTSAGREPLLDPLPTSSNEPRGGCMQGFRDDTHSGTTTPFSSGLSVAAYVGAGRCPPMLVGRRCDARGDEACCVRACATHDVWAQVFVQPRK